jgi:hypothetical protein
MYRIGDGEAGGGPDRKRLPVAHLVLALQRRGLAAAVGARPAQVFSAARRRKTSDATPIQHSLVFQIAIRATSYESEAATGILDPHPASG